MKAVSQTVSFAVSEYDRNVVIYVEEISIENVHTRIMDSIVGTLVSFGCRIATVLGCM